MLLRWLRSLRRPLPGGLPHEHRWVAAPGSYFCIVKGCTESRLRS